MRFYCPSTFQCITLVWRGKDRRKEENVGGAERQRGNYTKKGYFFYFENPAPNFSLSLEALLLGLL